MHCRSLLIDDLSLCPACWARINFIRPPYCTKCGCMLAYDGEVCGRCISYNDFSFAAARSLFMYDENSRDMMLKFKHSDQLSFGRLFARLAASMAKSMFESSDLIIPVPIHWTRLMTRRYNQAAIISMYLSRMTGLRFSTRALVRTRPTQPQHSSIDERIINVRGAFSVRKKRMELIKGHRILLVDDVFTTGATVNECSKTLLESGASSVNVITIARA